jgi:hypothetical protein
MASIVPGHVRAGELEALGRHHRLRTVARPGDE